MFSEELTVLSRNDWESEFFSRDIYSLDVDNWNLQALQRDVEQLAPDLVEARVSLREPSKISELVTAGFVIVESSLEFLRKINYGSERGGSYEVAKTGDTAELERIAADSITYSRFDHSVFGLNARQRVYMEWVTNAVKGKFDDICLINRVDGAITGFVTCRKEEGGCCRLGLLAVKGKYQGRGVGAALVEAAEVYARQEDCVDFRVSTQYGNRSAVMFYGKMGFMIDAIDLWLYRV